MQLDGDKPATRRRVTVREAAEALGLTVDAVRGRIKRGSLGHHKDPDGTVYVWLDADESRLSDDQPNDQPRLGEDDRDDLLVAELRDQVAFLRDLVRTSRDELRRERLAREEERRRHDTVIMQITQRIPELPSAAPPATAPRDAPQTAAEDAGGTDESRPTTEGPQEPPESRSWWRRWFWFE
jgi:hypothetical protein